MILDMHVHQMEHSSDSRLNIYNVVDLAKQRGLNGIVVTDHDTLGLQEKVKEISAEVDFPIFVGVEIYSLDGDLLCFGIDEMPEKRLSAQETIDFVNGRGGAVIAAHPFRNNRRGLEEVLKQVSGLAAIEGYNGRTNDFENMRAVHSALKLGIPISGGSDAHTNVEIGEFATAFEIEIHSEKDLVKALKSGQFKPVTLTGRKMNLLEIA